jgi:hypothetical protein
MLFLRQSSDATQMEESLSMTEALLVTLTTDKEEMTNQLAQLEDELDEVQITFNRSRAHFPREVMSIEYDDEIFTAAQDYHLEVLSLTASEPRDSKVNDAITFANTFFEVEVRGAISSILSFINNVATGGYFSAGAVELVNLEAPEPGQEEQPPTAIIKIVVYSYEG